MTDGMPGWMGNIHGMLPHQYCWVILTVLAILCGAVIGVERGKRQKPAGLRTMMLICLGASIFTLASVLIAGERADPGRIAAQVVTGAGFWAPVRSSTDAARLPASQRPQRSGSWPPLA